MDRSEDKFYEIAAAEIASKQSIPSVWAKAFSEALGNRDMAVALYIQYRVERLCEEHQEELARKEAENRIEQESILRGKRMSEDPQYASCPRMGCGFEGKFLRGPDLNVPLAIVLLLLGLVPGVIYLARAKDYYFCPRCWMKLTKEELENARNT